MKVKGSLDFEFVEFLLAANCVSGTFLIDEYIGSFHVKNLFYLQWKGSRQNQYFQEEEISSLLDIQCVFRHSLHPSSGSNQAEQKQDFSFTTIFCHEPQKKICLISIKRIHPTTFIVRQKRKRNSVICQLSIH